MSRSLVSSRRTFLERSAVAALGLTGCTGPAAMTDDTFTGTPTGDTGAPSTGCPDPFAGGEFLEVVPFSGEPANPFGALQGEGLDARQVYDLQRTEEHGGVTPNDLYYVRTAYPDLLTTSKADWVLRVDGQVGTELALPLAALEAMSSDQGLMVMECSGNSPNRAFGLMSAARWGGVPVADVLDAFVDVDAAATRIEIAGFDEHSVPSDRGHSTPGASWIFTLDELAEYGAFFAFTMNGAPLSGDHGFPVRLMVPRWWGCACIKWVDHLSLVDDDVEATSQMREFAERTHQTGVPTLARDYRPAAMQHAATPVRIEKWRIDGEIAYRVLGIKWGGEQATDKLMISFDGRERAVDVCPPRENLDHWALWVHRYNPRRTGEVLVTTRVDDAVPQVRLNQGWYDRTFVVDEI